MSELATNPGPESADQADKREELTDQLRDIAREVNRVYTPPEGSGRPDLRPRVLDPADRDDRYTDDERRQKQIGLNVLHAASEIGGTDISPALRAAAADLVDPNVELGRRSAVRASQMDAMTGLANRGAFERAIASANDDPDVSFLVIDGDNFGQVNKILGYDDGDAVILEAADAVATATTEAGISARIFRLGREDVAGSDDAAQDDEHGAPAYRTGGDEFVVLGSAERLAQVQQRAEEIFLKSLHDKAEIPNARGEMVSTVRILDAMSAHHLSLGMSSEIAPRFEEADQAMQANKKARKAAQAAALPKIDTPPGA